MPIDLNEQYHYWFTKMNDLEDDDDDIPTRVGIQMWDMLSSQPKFQQAFSMSNAEVEWVAYRDGLSDLNGADRWQFSVYHSEPRWNDPDDCALRIDVRRGLKPEDVTITEEYSGKTYILKEKPMKLFGLLELRRVLGPKHWLLFIAGCALFTVTTLSLLITAVVLLS
jgi:hypothetical protein